MVTRPRPDTAPAPADDSPAFEIPAGMIQEPILTLDLAQRIGIETARAAVAEAMARLQETQALVADVFRAVGLDPNVKYEIDREGHVFPGPAPENSL